MMKEKISVFKFGGASVRNARSVINLANILKKHRNKKIIVVISAIDKTTRELEKLTRLYFSKQDYFHHLQKIILKHQTIINGLFADKNSINSDFEQIVDSLKQKLLLKPSSNFDFEYDQIVVYGELLSTKIISAYLQQEGINCRWIDIRNFIKTDSNYRNAAVDWQISKTLLSALQIHDNELVLTQGFIASNKQAFNTTLGLEGSDFTAAIIAHALDAHQLIVWKDVAGFYSSDPKMFDNVVKLDAISFHEAVELAYYGAKIIHPKTIKPLQNKKIPLIIKSFIEPDKPGTIVKNSTQNKSGLLPEVPVFITKNNQILISVAPLDFSFISEDNLSDIFALLAKYRVKVNLMQNSAISFSICADNRHESMQHLIPELQKKYKVLYNENLSLITIRHYDALTIKKLTRKRKIFVQQKSRNTARFVVK